MKVPRVQKLPSISSIFLTTTICTYTQTYTHICTYTQTHTHIDTCCHITQY